MTAENEEPPLAADLIIAAKKPAEYMVGMTEQTRLVSAESERPLREAGIFVVVTFLIAAGVYHPLLATDMGWIDTTLPPGCQSWEF